MSNEEAKAGSRMPPSEERGLDLARKVISRPAESTDLLSQVGPLPRNYCSKTAFRRTHQREAESLVNILQVQGFFTRHFSLWRQSRATTSGGTILRIKRLPRGLLLPIACESTMVDIDAVVNLNDRPNGNSAPRSSSVGHTFFGTIFLDLYCAALWTPPCSITNPDGIRSQRHVAI
jgi:hypothetical protein